MTVSALKHDLDTVALPKVREIERQADQHARWLWESGIRFAKAMRDGDPARAEVELRDVAARMVHCESLVDDLTRALGLKQPELDACVDCGTRESRCQCDASDEAEEALGQSARNWRRE